MHTGKLITGFLRIVSMTTTLIQGRLVEFEEAMEAALADMVATPA